MPRGKFRRERVKELGDVHLDSRTSRIVEKKIAQAEAELAQEVRVNFRWGRQQLKLIQNIAGKMGVPYQTYIKQVLYRQALQDLKTVNEAELVK
jgi:predicted DNA binding CopG/RHH family protein